MATATQARRTMKSSKYPGWAIEKTPAGEFLMTRDGGIFAIGVGCSDELGWAGVLLTRQRGGWRPARTPYVHSVLGCIQEADRREGHIRKYGARPLAGLSK